MFDLATAMSTTDLSKLTKDEVSSQLLAAYSKAKPINDQMVDVSLEIQQLVAEIYRRTIVKNLGMEPVRVKCAMAIACNVHPNKGVPELVQRIAALQSNGLEIVRVEFNENLNEFRFYVEEATPQPHEPARYE